MTGMQLVILQCTGYPLPATKNYRAQMVTVPKGEKRCYWTIKHNLGCYPFFLRSKHQRGNHLSQPVNMCLNVYGQASVTISFLQVNISQTAAKKRRL